MRRKSFVFLFLFAFVLPSFAATPTESDSGSSTLGKPSVTFKEWQIGRSPINTDTNAANHNPTSFITTSERLCRFTASVGYDGAQGDSVSPIDPDTVSWSVIDTDPSNMALVESSVEKNWSGDKHPSKLDPSTSFNVVGEIDVPAFSRNTSCSHNDDDRLKRIPRHRGNTKLGFTLKFTANTEDGQSVETTLVLKADDIDQVRQEYVDYNKPIPERGDARWQNQDTYDFGHYKIMLNYLLSSKHQDWVDEINELRGTDKDTGEKIPAFSVGDFVLTSGYRHPHHNYEHTPSTALLSPHMYGYALDVRGKTDAQDNVLDIDGDKKNTDADRDIMDRAAKPNAGARYTNIYPSKHVHADWAPSNWTSRTKTSSAAPSFSLPAQGTDTREVVSPALVCPDPSNHKSECWVSCDEGHRRAYYFSCEFASCPECDYIASQPPPSPEPSPEPAPEPSPPAPTITCSACEGSYAPGSYFPNDHRYISVCGKTNASGQRCTNTSGYYVCAPHTHTYVSTTVSNPPTSNPPTSNPPTSNPPTNNPPTSHPPTSNPPTSHPPTSNPPTSNPPTENVPEAPPAPITYHACGVHESTVSGDHSLQASCSRDSSCIATNFYYCQHSSHEYAPPAPEPPPVAVVLCGNKWQGEGKCKYDRVISGTDPQEHRATCSAGHKYWTCNENALDHHKDRTCTRLECGVTYQGCTNAAGDCLNPNYLWHSQKPLVACGGASYTGCSGASSRTEHHVPLCSNGCGNGYWTCSSTAYENHEQTFTCRRSGCGVSFTRCTNGPSACVRAGHPSNYHWAAD